MLKFKLAALAVILAAGGAFATVKKSAFAAHKWSLDSGVYTDITGQREGVDYNCELGSTTCTATYPQGQDPNVDSSNPTSTETGVFN